jgi:hypothetical protein
MMNILNSFCSSQLGFSPVGEIRMATNGASNAHLYFRDKINEANLHTSLWKAEEAIITQRNDVILVTPESHAWLGDAGAAVTTLTWDKQSTHVLGMDVGGKGGYQRARLSNAAVSTDVALLTVSGATNTFKNLRIMHGVSEHDHTLLDVTGSGNKFENVCFATPLISAQATSTDYLPIKVSGSHNYFKTCLFGTANAVYRNAVNSLLYLSGTGSLNIFEDCIFNSLGSDIGAFFINWASTESTMPNGIFLNCQFIHARPAASSNLTYAITDSSHANNRLFFDNRCTFVNVDDIVATAKSAKISWGGSGANPDTTAIADRKQLGIAQAPVVG